MCSHSESQLQAMTTNAHTRQTEASEAKGELKTLKDQLNDLRLSQRTWQAMAMSKIDVDEAKFAAFMQASSSSDHSSA